MSNDKDLMGYDPLEWLKEENSGDSNEAAMEPEPAENNTEESVIEAHSDAPVISEEASSEPEIEEPAETVQEPGNDPVFDFQQSLQIMDVAILKPQLEEALTKLKDITLRADPDITVDGAGMQLLLAFVQQAASSGVALQWEALPSPISEAAKLLNTEQVLLPD